MQKVKNKRVLIIRFAVLYVVSLALLVVLFSAFSKKAPDENGETMTGVKDADLAYATVVEKEETLRLSYYQLLLSDENYLHAAAAGKKQELAALKEVSEQRLSGFESLLKTTTATGSNDPEDARKELVKVRDFFNTMLATRKLNMGIPAGTIAMGTATSAAPGSKEMDRLKMEIVDKDDQLADLQARLQASSATKQAGASKEMDNLHTQLNSVQAKLTGTEAQVGSLQKQLAAVPKTNNNASQVQQLQAELSKKNNQLAAMQQLQAELAKKNTQVTSLQKQLASGKPAVTSDSKQLLALQNELATKNRQIAALQKQSQKPSTGAGDATVAELLKRNENLVTGFKSIQTQMGMLQKNYNILKAENNRLAGRSGE